jgi:hypothetical protein
MWFQEYSYWKEPWYRPQTELSIWQSDSRLRQLWTWGSPVTAHVSWEVERGLVSKYWINISDVSDIHYKHLLSPPQAIVTQWIWLMGKWNECGLHRSQVDLKAMLEIVAAVTILESSKLRWSTDLRKLIQAGKVRFIVHTENDRGPRYSYRRPLEAIEHRIHPDIRHCHHVSYH